MKNRTKLPRPDGSVVIITIDLDSDGDFELADVAIAKTKRSIAKSVCEFNSILRSLRIEQRHEYRQQEFLKHVTPSEVLAAKLEFWEKIKPTK